jgi:hypothetical protein
LPRYITKGSLPQPGEPGQWIGAPCGIRRA